MKSLSLLILLAVATLARAQDLSTANWRMWPDTNAAWVNDPLFLPDQVVLPNLPNNPPTGGWSMLNAQTGIPVTLPGTVEQYYWAQLGQGTTPENGNYLGVSWWWRTFTAPSFQPGQRVIIRFRAARMRAEVYCNQQLCGYNLITEVPFEADVTSALQPGTNNLLAVRITNPGGALDWRDIDDPGLSWGTNAMPRSHGFGGLDENIILEVRDPVTVNDLAVLNQTNPSEVWMVGEMKSTGPAYSGPVNLNIQQGSNLVWQGSVNVTVPAGGTNYFTNDVVVANAQIWDLTNPVLYTASAAIPGSNFSGRCVNFGFRWFDAEGIGSNALLRLNGRRMVLRSAISWGYWEPNGLFPNDALAQKEVLAAKTLGLNCLNFHRNIGHPNVFDQQDQLGLLRYEEAGAGFNAYTNVWNANGNQEAPPDLSGNGGAPTDFRGKYEVAKILAMLRRDRSHPSLVVYCIQNEQQPDMNNPRIFWLIHQMQAVDPSRIIVLHSGVVSFNQVVALPWSTNLLHEDGTGYSGWQDQHTVGGPGNYQDSLYLNPTSYSHFTSNTREIVDWGEMLGAGMPDDHEKIVNHYQTNHSTGYDLQLHQTVLGAYNSFLDQWNWRSSFPTASSVFYEIGKKSYFFWQKIMENSRICDANDFLTISGWESTTIDNHSGIVDAARDFRTDPTILSRAMAPEVLVIRPRRFVLKPGDTDIVDIHLINETGRTGQQLLTVTALNPDGSTLMSTQQTVSVTGGDVFGQLLVPNLSLTAATNGTVRILGTLQPQGGTGSVLTNETDVLVIDPLIGAPLLQRVAVVEGDGKVSQTISNVFGITPLDATHLNDPLDAIVMPGGGSWLGTYYGIGNAIQNTADPGLYQTQDYGKTGTIGVWTGFAPGQCTVQFYLAEQYWTGPGQRLFDVAVNGNLVMQNFDIFQQAGGQDRALIETFNVSAPNGTITVTVPNVEVDNASFAGIKITDSTGKVLRIAFHQSPYTDSTGQVWQTYASSLASSSAQWATILNRVSQGVRLVLWPNGLSDATLFANQLIATNIVQSASAAGNNGSLGQATAPWMGSWYFARNHWLFDGLPANTVLGWQYQIPQQNQDIGALLLNPVQGYPMEVMAGYGRDHEAAVGIAGCVIHYGRGLIVFPCLPALKDALASTGMDITQPVALRLLANALRSQPGTLPSPWQWLEIGNVVTNGYSWFEDNTFGLAAGGADIWNQADAFGYIYQPLNGDGVITVRVANQQPTDPWAKAGVMIRESLTPGSRHATMVVTPGSLASFQRRLVTGDISYEDQVTVTSGTNGAAPYWVRLARNGDNMTGYYSPDGVNWTQCGPTITLTNLPASVYWGLPVTAHTTSTTSLASFDQLTLNHKPVLAPVASRNIGAGVIMQVTNAATDPDVPPQILTYSLPAAPPGAMIDPNAGLVTWRPGVATAGTTNTFTVAVTDNGSPALGATQSFQVNINPLAHPSLSKLSLMNGQFQFLVSGDFGPDYFVQTSTNLSGLANWTTVWVTNSPPLPFQWTSTVMSNSPAQFYRVMLGPL